MNKVRVFILTLLRYIKAEPAKVILPLAVFIVMSASVIAAITIKPKSDNKASLSRAEKSAVEVDVAAEQEVESEPEQPEPVVQPIEKKVEYKGKSINVVKVEVAKADSKEDAQNGSYKKTETQVKAQPAATTVSKVIQYKKPGGSFAGGIDVSSHNGVIDWAKVDNSGVDFAMIRCGYRGYLTGKIVMDACFEYNIENAYKNGIAVGMYFYSTAVNEDEALEEAAYVVELIKAQQEKGIFVTYPVAYDFEEFYNNDSRTRAKGLSAAVISKNTSAFLDFIAEQGYKPMLYAGKNPIKTYWEQGMAEKYDFWLAHYTEATEYTGTFFMWQYTSSGSVAGINGRVDLDICGFEDNNNLPRFSVCTKDGVKAFAKPQDGSQALITLKSDTVYLWRNTFTPDYKEIKLSGKYYYVNSNELTDIPFEENNTAYKTAAPAALYSKPFDDTYKTDVTLPEGTTLNVEKIWADKWAQILYDGKVCYIKANTLTKDDTPPQNEYEDSPHTDNEITDNT